MKFPPIAIFGVCCNTGCKRVSVSAHRLSDFWVTFCEICQGTKITLDMDKIAAAKDAAGKLRGME